VEPLAHRRTGLALGHYEGGGSHHTRVPEVTIRYNNRAQCSHYRESVARAGVQQIEDAQLLLRGHGPCLATR
jgi:hypothetical protein